MPDSPPARPASRRLRRRLIATAAVLLLATLAAWVLRETAGSSLPATTVSSAQTAGTRVVRFDVESRAADRRLVQTVVLPRGTTAGRPLLLLLHGKSQDPAWLAGGPLRAAVARLGDRAPIVVLPADDGGSYWHDRRSGRWERYLLDEALPAAVRRWRADGTRIAIGGISMGGAGAFAIARRHPGRFCAVGGHSAALWPDAAATAPGAYDDRADFLRHDPVAPARAGRDPYGVPLWLDAGRSDPFAPTIDRFAAALRRNGEALTVRRGAGGHEGRYWERHMAAYLRFYADALADCRPRAR